MPRAYFQIWLVLIDRLCTIRACIQIGNGIANAMHLIVVDEVPMDYNLRYRIPESLWKRFKNVLDLVEAETARAEALAAPGPSSKR